MLPSQSLQSLYMLAIAEGGGVGSAYAFYVRRLLLSSWLAGIRPNLPVSPRILIAGLPEQVGYSLDLLLIAQQLGATPLVVDDRPSALEGLNQAIATGKRLGVLPTAHFKGLVVNDMGVMWEAATDFDLVLSVNVLQRLDASTQQAYLAHLAQIARHSAVFCPNQNNRSYLAQRKTDGVSLAVLGPMSACDAPRTGYIGLPPFTNLVSLSQLARDQTISQRLLRIALVALQFVAWFERFTPQSIQATRAQTVYALCLSH